MLTPPCNKDYSPPRKRRRVGRIRKERMNGFLKRIGWDEKGGQDGKGKEGIREEKSWEEKT